MLKIKPIIKSIIKNIDANIACIVLPPKISISLRKFFWIIVPIEIPITAIQQLKNPNKVISPPILGEITIITPIMPKSIPNHLSIDIFSFKKMMASKHVKIGWTETIREEIPAEVPLVIAKKTPPR